MVTRKKVVVESGQMLFKCPQCGTEDLLGLTDRHCPSCGQVQEENLRYFPSNDKATTFVRKHGPKRDRECDHCGSPNARDAENCVDCGAPMKGTKSVHVRKSIPAHMGETAKDAERDWKERKKKKREERRRSSTNSQTTTRVRTLETLGVSSPGSFRRAPVVQRKSWDPSVVLISLGGLIFFSMFLTCLLWKKEIQVEAVSHSWERSVDVYRYKTLEGTDWCGDVPSDAKVFSKEKKQRGTKTVVVDTKCETIKGECHIDRSSCEKEDQGDGTYNVVCDEVCTEDREECTDVTEEQPVFDWECEYTINRWRHLRTETSSGRDLNPYNPEFTFQECTFVTPGCEDTRNFQSDYRVLFRDLDSSETFTCHFDEYHWRQVERGSHWSTKVGVILRNLDCRNLEKSV